MKKKIFAVVALAAILATGSVFADHPSGWGVGIQGGGNGGWSGGSGAPGVALSLKFPSLPVYWAVNLGFNSSHFAVGLSGDYYLIDQTLVSDIGLNWFLGIGGWVNLYSWSERFNDKKETSLSFALGARVPIGLSWQPINWFELFIDFAPSLGIGINSEAKYKDAAGNEHVWREGGVSFPAGGWGVDFGFRFWL